VAGKAGFGEGGNAPPDGLCTQRERVLITGGTGFVGANLTRGLIAGGRHEVHLLLRPDSARWRLADVEDRCTLHWGDIRQADAVCQAVAASRPDVVYHLAAYGAYDQDRTAALATNLLGTANLLGALEGHLYRAFVYAGSSSEYGHRSGPIREQDRLEPRTDYAVGKAAATLLCQAEAYKGRPVVIVRIFSAYGPWEHPARLISYVMGCCLSGEAPKVTAGAQPRDFIYVEDVLALLQRAATCPAAFGHVLHAGTGRQHTVREVVETTLAVCAGGSLVAEFGAVPTRRDEPSSWVASIEHTTALTGWRPQFDLRAGIAHMWSQFTQAVRRKAA
jgi:nucleoside-diphosphate-sugar epimerase